MDNAVLRPDLLLVADAVSKERGIAREDIIVAIEDALAKTGRATYGHDKDIRVKIDRKSGAVSMSRWTEVVDPASFVPPSTKKMDALKHIYLENARRIKPDAVIGEFLIEPLPPIEFGRVGAQTAKQVIVQRVKEIERKRQYAIFKDRVGEIISGVVKRVDYAGVVLDIGSNTEGMLSKKDLILRESFKIGDRVRAYIADVREEQKGPQVFLSRTHDGFLVKLFAQEVPEIYDGTIEIKAVARDPGSRAKMAVISRDSSTSDPAAVCIGRNGARVKAVSSEICGEKIDVIRWSPNIATFVADAIAPASVMKVIISETEQGRQKLTLVVPEDQMSLAIGRRGQNVRLAGQLTHSLVELLTEAQEHERRTEETGRLTSLFMNELEVDDLLAAFLVTEGFTTIEELASCPLEELAGIEGLDEVIAEELLNRAFASLDRTANARASAAEGAGVDSELIAFEFLNADALVALGNAGVKTRDDLADLSTEELIEVLGPSAPSPSVADSWIMQARAHWFEQEELETA